MLHVNIKNSRCELWDILNSITQHGNIIIVIQKKFVPFQLCVMIYQHNNSSDSLIELVDFITKFYKAVKMLNPSFWNKNFFGYKKPISLR